MTNVSKFKAEVAAEEIWAQLEWEHKKNPLALAYPSADIAAAWVGPVNSGGPDCTGASVYPVKNSKNEICDLLVMKHLEHEDGCLEFHYVTNGNTEGCSIQFGESNDIKLVCSDMRTSAALAQTSGYPTYFSLYKENVNDVAQALASSDSQASVVIVDDSYRRSKDTPEHVLVLVKPAKGFLAKTNSDPDQLISKIQECIDTPPTTLTPEESEFSTTIQEKPNSLVNGVGLLRKLTKVIHDCISMRDEAALIFALYAFFTYVAARSSYAPILCVTSPVRRCGKSTLIQLAMGVFNSPGYVKGATKASLEMLANASITPLIDEFDQIIKNDPGVIGLLNGGVEAGAEVVLAGSRGAVTVRKTYGAKLIGMIGVPPETIYDRSINIKMRRKKPNDVKEKSADKQALLAYLKREIQQWCEMNEGAFSKMRVEPLDVDNDRYRDNYEPILRIAACLSPDVALEARNAAIKLASDQLINECSGEQLIVHIKEIFDTKKSTVISSQDLIVALCKDEDSEWLRFEKNRPISSVDLARILHTFGVQPAPIWFGPKQARGYRREWLEDAFSRYCPENNPPHQA